MGGIRTDEKILCEILANSENELWLYFDDNQLLGCVNLSNKGQKLYLGMLTVSPEHQDRGIGKALLTFSEDRAKELGISAIEMTVITLRKELIAWYERKGYKQTGEKRPFPMDNPDFGEAKVFLEFVVLKKSL